MVLHVFHLGKPRRDGDVELVPSSGGLEESIKGEGGAVDTTGWAPRPIAVSGPAFKLAPEVRQDINRLQQNVGQHQICMSSF